MAPPRDTDATTCEGGDAASSPISDEQQGQQQPNNKQHLFLIRHGDRWDYENPQWNSKDTSRVGDSPLSKLGLQQARETGAFLGSVLAKEGILSHESPSAAKDNITWLSSPFLRCLQTSQEAINALSSSSSSSSIPIKPEYSVFEWDGKGGKWHQSLPPIEERVHYFPSLDLNYESMFVPAIPEPRSQFHDRCDRAVKCLNQRYRYEPNTAIVVVTHAAGCIGLSKSAANLELEDVTPAGPCAVYQLTRSSDTDVWQLDPHDKGTDDGADCKIGSKSMNGHSDHISDMGTNTVPWNNFHDKSVHQGYSGPPASRFAPQSLKDELLLVSK